MQYRHEDWDHQAPPVEKPVFGSEFLDRTLTDSATVSLRFKKDEIDIPDSEVHVNEEYAAHPVESSADNDYGVIMLPEGVKAPEDFGDFGFSLHLGVADRLDCDLFVTGYRADSGRGKEPVTSSGRCVNPIVRENQLEYLVATEGGLSGSPVWVGYKTHPTVVAIQRVFNYGPKLMRPGYGSRGTRINFKSIRDIFTWTGVDTTPKVLRVSTPKAPE
ncbi:hypothetical protein SLS58_006545 [Diplodia intermedia]|uniref:Uncharacterized protein n=1 Tax=Diplodia intermedia TaxID=856260 RepID=A0ABR3TMU8_9PEZI